MKRQSRSQSYRMLTLARPPQPLRSSRTCASARIACLPSRRKRSPYLGTMRIHSEPFSALTEASVVAVREAGEAVGQWPLEVFVVFGVYGVPCGAALSESCACRVHLLTEKHSSSSDLSDSALLTSTAVCRLRRGPSRCRCAR